jgi:hypothetical protein
MRTTVDQNKELLDIHNEVGHGAMGAVRAVVPDQDTG